MDLPSWCMNMMVYLCDQADIDKNTIDYSAAAGTSLPGDMKFKDIERQMEKSMPTDRVRLEKNRDPMIYRGFEY